MHGITPLLPVPDDLRPTGEMNEVAVPPVRPGDDAALIDSLVRAGCQQRSFEPGWTLVEAGDVHASMYVLVQGEVEVRLGAIDGKALATLVRGDIVGEMSMVDDSAACAFVVAQRHTTAIEVPREAFWSIVETSHVFARRLLEALSRRLRANNVTVAQSAQRSEQLLKAATRDPLTGLHNRRWLDAKLAAWAAECQERPRPFAFGLLDIDHFKSFNDTFGHRAGDQVLATFGEVVAGCLRSSDAVVRWGGEEFAVVLPGAPLQPAIAALERARAAVKAARCRCPEGRELPPITFSAGLVAVETFEPERLVATADVLLYRAKAQGRDRTCADHRLGD